MAIDVFCLVLIRCKGFDFHLLSRANRRRNTFTNINQIHYFLGKIKVNIRKETYEKYRLNLNSKDAALPSSAENKIDI